MFSSKKKSVLEMDYKEAKQFFMKDESYCTLQLPEYFSFNGVLEKADQMLTGKSSRSQISISSIQSSEIKEANVESINCDIVINKDGKYDWRPMKIVHPVAYVDLVNTVTSRENWEKIKSRFNKFKQVDAIKCISMPLKAIDNKSNDTKEVILNWWDEFEQYSIKAALEYSYCVQTDITNCYGSIYTHSIPWALEGKETAKKNRGKSALLGNQIDTKIRNLQYGQTNGIPQGGRLFDFIAEIVLGYADKLLGKKLTHLENYQVIRFRDDYRIFSNSKEDLNTIVKQLSDILSELNMHFNIKKTKYTEDLIGSAIKPDKMYWNSQSISIFSSNKDSSGKREKDDHIVYHLGLQKHLLEIYKLAKKFPNSGSIKRAFSEYNNRLDDVDSLPEDYQQLISITASIVISNPDSIPQGIAIISHIFNLMKKSKSNDMPNNIREFIKQILEKLHTIPNTEYLEIWLQRISVTISKDFFSYNTPICEKVMDSANNIWDSSWLAKGFDESSIIDNQKLNDAGLDIPRELVDPFNYPY